ncbi:MAG: pyruvate:ferredoxin (flavodoxin) oxidoreductase [Deltaproteobacteria bacterium]|nr:pyruvate:ferredoxin (flavodoxin) oxidoreductase [Deltaproteobacteria bacterium]
MSKQFTVVDGNEAAAKIAYLTNEVIAIYPITPASPMGEFADAWAAENKINLFGTVPQVIEMQSEAGAAGAVHGALQAGSLATTFTASQGLLLMIPTMYKTAGEFLPTVFHISARTLATHALSIFGDHSDVMAVRSTGWAMLASNSVQEAHDFALISQMATLESRVPFVHFFDGFRTSHEVAKIEEISPEQVRELIDEGFIRAHRNRALTPDHPVLRGSAQNPDVFFQAREAGNPFYLAVPQMVERSMRRLAKMTNRQYRLFDYMGAADAERVMVLMGSGAGAAEEAVTELMKKGEKVGLLKVRLFRPFSCEHFVAALPQTVKTVTVLDRTKEPGAVGEPLYQDVVTALAENWKQAKQPRIIGGRFGLSSKEFTPAMALSVFQEAKKELPKNHFTVGINDDVTHTSLEWDDSILPEPKDVKRAVFFGLGSDGTVSANKNSVKIIGEGTDLYAQGYFVYDSKKAGSVTVSHLRFSPRPIQATYLILKANFVACHQFQFLERIDVLSLADQGATFLLNSPFGPDEIWEKLPVEVQRQIIEKKLKFYVVDGYRVARETGMGGRTNTIMQTCFFALADILPAAEAIAGIKKSIEKTYGRRGPSVLEKNFAAVDNALKALCEVTVPNKASGSLHMLPPVPDAAPAFVKKVTAPIIEGRGDSLPVSAMPADGTFPVGTAQYEKRSIALEIPFWDPKICTDCGLCIISCPHAAIRMKVYEPSLLPKAPKEYLHKNWAGKDFAGSAMTIQVAPDDCTGCGVCVDVCPSKSRQEPIHKAIEMTPKPKLLEQERRNFDFFLTIPEVDRQKVKADTVKGSQLLQPLFEFSGACAGCGETPYLKLLTQLFGDRLLVSNATGCSSIFGGNLPTTPWTTNHEGRGPAWVNPLFEDAAEFGLGMRASVDQTRYYAKTLLEKLRPTLGPLVDEILNGSQNSEQEIQTLRQKVALLKQKLATVSSVDAATLSTVADSLVRKSVWSIGGDGWAYDIGFGGLDHVLALKHKLNLLVLDTGVYSNTGGQASKSTPRGAVARFAAAGKQQRTKDLGTIAISYGNAYVAKVALGANPLQTIRAFHEAESYDGPALIIAYSTCIAHGIDMCQSLSHQKEAVRCGFWPLYRYDPRLAATTGKPFQLDSSKPSVTFKDFAMKEQRFASLARSHPEQAERLFAEAQKDIVERWVYYELLASSKLPLAQAANDSK